MWYSTLVLILKRFLWQQTSSLESSKYRFGSFCSFLALFWANSAPKIHHISKKGCQIKACDVSHQFQFWKDVLSNKKVSKSPRSTDLALFAPFWPFCGLIGHLKFITYQNKGCQIKPCDVSHQFQFWKDVLSNKQSV